MKNLKKLTSVFLAVIMLLAMSTTAFAAVGDTGFSDVAANAWYADAVTYVRDHGLMSGTSTTTFSPEATTSRGQIATILYRAAGSPAVTGGTDFPDVASTAYYADAMVIGMVQKHLSLPKRLLRVIAVVIAAYGASAFFRREFPAYLFLKTHFVFLDFEEPFILFFLDHIGIMCFFAIIGHYMIMILISPLHRTGKNNA